MVAEYLFDVKSPYEELLPVNATLARKMNAVYNANARTVRGNKFRVYSLQGQNFQRVGPLSRNGSNNDAKNTRVNNSRVRREMGIKIGVVSTNKPAARRIANEVLREVLRRNERNRHEAVMRSLGHVSLRTNNSAARAVFTDKNLRNRIVNQAKNATRTRALSNRNLLRRNWGT